MTSNRISILEDMHIVPRRASTNDIEMGIISPVIPVIPEPASPAAIANHSTPLIRLPTELKIKIYKFVLRTPNAFVWVGGYKKPHRKPLSRTAHKSGTATYDPKAPTVLSLLLISRDIYFDAREVLLCLNAKEVRLDKHNSFRFNCRTRRTSAGLLTHLAPSMRLNALTTGLPLAFESELFCAEVRKITIACANEALEHVSNHKCGVTERVLTEIVGLCPELKEMNVGPPVTDPNWRWRSPWFWNRWLYPLAVIWVVICCVGVWATVKGKSPRPVNGGQGVVGGM